MSCQHPFIGLINIFIFESGESGDMLINIFLTADVTVWLVQYGV